MEMCDLAVGVLQTGTMRAMNIFGLGGKIPGRVQSDQPGGVDGSHGRQQTGFIKSPMQSIKEPKELARFHRVQCLAEVVVARDGGHLKKGTGVVASAGFFHVLLEAQEGRTLGEED